MSVKVPATKYCCEGCFADYAIRDYIRDIGMPGKCNFCNKTDLQVADTFDVSEFIDEGLEHKYNFYPIEDYAKGNVPLNGIDETPLFYNVILTIEEAAVRSYGILPEIRLTSELEKLSKFQGGYFQKKMPTPNHMRLFDLWLEFTEYVKHTHRFTALMDLLQVSTSHTSKFTSKGELALSTLTDQFRGALNELRKPLETRTIFRARLDDGDDLLPSEEITSPPVKKAASNRMSPAGVSYFYGAEDAVTAGAELRPRLDGGICIGEFAIIRELAVFDLVDVRPKYSIFDSENRHLHTENFSYAFMRDFARNIARPMDPNSSHIDYVPTQLICELIKNNPWGHQIDGIRFPSSQRRGGINIVLFRGPEISIAPEPWIELSDQRRYKVNAITYDIDIDSFWLWKHQQDSMQSE